MLAVGDERRHRDGLLPWLAVAAAVHAAALLAHASPSFASQAASTARFAAAITIDVVRAPSAEATPDPVEPPKDPEVTPPSPAQPVLVKAPETPAAVALIERPASVVEAAAAALGAAAKTLFRDDDAPDADSIVSGDASELGYGYVAANGSGRGTFDRNARAQGKLGGRGSSESPKAGVDRTRGAHVIGGYANDCPFPEKADGIDHITVDVVVHVGADGKAKDVIVVRDPGHGFGEAARRCALKHPFAAARDHDGKPTEAITAPVAVRFTR